MRQPREYTIQTHHCPVGPERIMGQCVNDYGVGRVASGERKDSRVGYPHEHYAAALTAYQLQPDGLVCVTREFEELRDGSLKD